MLIALSLRKLPILWLDARSSERQDRVACPPEKTSVEHPWLPIVSLRRFLGTKRSRVR